MNAQSLESMDFWQFPDGLPASEVRRRAARSLAFGLVLFVPGLALAALFAEWSFVAALASALGTVGLPLVVIGSFRLIFGAGGQSRSLLASIGRIVFGLVAIIATLALAFTVIALFARR